MANFDEYKDSCQNAKLERSPDGVLEVTLHSNGDALIPNGGPQEEFVDLFNQIVADGENRVIILSGGEDEFMPRAREIAQRLANLLR
jgi:hypothetical protein